MSHGLLVRLRVTSPWRIGPDDGADDEVGRIYHSDSVGAAVAAAMRQLGLFEEWLEDTVRRPAGAVVRFSSCYPWQQRTLFVVPPRTLWPPATAGKLRVKGARFIPVSLVSTLLAEGHLSEDDWMVDGTSQCLMRRESKTTPAGPFRLTLRSAAAVDRLAGGNVLLHRAACLEFADDAGLWMLVEFTSADARDRWAAPVLSALRLLCDSGFGGGRSRGWGRAELVEAAPGEPGQLVVPGRAANGDSPVTEAGEPPAPAATAHWLISLYSPAPDENVDWHRGQYSLVDRGGRVESPAGWGAVKKQLRMIEEGSVVVSAEPPRGVARDVAPEGFPHPVFRFGFATSIPIPLQGLPAPRGGVASS